MTKFGVIVFLMALMSCSTIEQQSDQQVDFYSSELFHDVQLSGIFEDSKTFVDCIPKRDLNSIINDYLTLRSAADFDLREFVGLNFDLPSRPKSSFATDTRSAWSNT